MATATTIATKEPWQMTKDEWGGYYTEEFQLLLKEKTNAVNEIHDLSFESANYKLITRAQNRLSRIQSRIEQISNPNYLNRTHKQIISLALSEGKPVPAEVLKDYPELGKGEPKQRTLGGGNVPDIGSIGNPVVSSYGLPAYRHDGFWYTEGWSMSGSGKLDWHRVTDPRFQTECDALYASSEDIAKGHTDAKAWLAEAKEKTKTWGNPKAPAKPEAKVEGTGKDIEKLPTANLSGVGTGDKFVYVKTKEGWVKGEVKSYPFGFKGKNAQIQLLEGSRKGRYVAIDPIQEYAKVKRFVGAQPEAAAEAKAKPEPKQHKEIGILQTKPTKQSDRALAIDRSLLAKQVVSVDDPRWLKRPNRFDVRGVDTPGSHRIIPGVAYADRGKQRLSRKHHRGWKKVKFG
jgi:hypothetical protein